MWNSAGDPMDSDARADDADRRDEPSDSEVVLCSLGSARDDDPVVAKLAVSHRDVVLGEAIRAAPSVTVEPNYRTTDGGAAVLVFTAAGESIVEFDAALSTDHTVRDPQLLARTDDACTYRVRFSSEALQFSPVFADLGALLYDVRTAGRSWSFHVRFPSHEAFASFRNFCSSHEVTLRLFKLSADEQHTRGDDLGLTASQWDTLSTAHEMGYFEVPRGATQEELARQLDISPSAVSQRIRRATNQLLAETLASSRFRTRF
ncbi:GAF and HTH_10 associated domain-containing protein [Halomicrobium zhouii]|uniref:GAF and HTH_10 associated domain-containing protein n=1 Tax=Halomicrobium zhouii TaxID=767519 RepID=A0A1I6KC56_9EURY|nr:helix-turn-helix domain-containing protein [Halomicrobium zhouii]SFR88822.1 GAF and HTH_10 associated domain-containing protein [Halomicrobium zhouii]